MGRFGCAPELGAQHPESRRVPQELAPARSPPEPRVQQGQRWGGHPEPLPHTPIFAATSDERRPHRPGGHSAFEQWSAIPEPWEEKGRSL